MEPSLEAKSLEHATLVAWNWAQAFLPRLAAAIAILIAGFAAVNWLARTIERLLWRLPHMDTTLRPILIALVRYAALIVIVVAALSQLGIQTTSLLAVIGAAGLAIGLALQGTLSNIAAGIMLLWLRPFHAGDFIEVGGQAGTVEEIGLFVCRLRTFDGLFLFLPNSAIWNAALKNYTRNAGRLVSIAVAVPAAADLDRARQALLEVAGHTHGTLRAPAPYVFVDNIGGGAMVLNLSVWTEPQGAGAVERAIIEGSKRGLEALGENFTPTAIARVTPPSTDPSPFLASREPGF